MIDHNDILARIRELDQEIARLSEQRAEAAYRAGYRSAIRDAVETIRVCQYGRDAEEWSCLECAAKRVARLHPREGERSKRDGCTNGRRSFSE